MSRYYYVGTSGNDGMVIPHYSGKYTASIINPTCCDNKDTSPTTIGHTPRLAYIDDRHKAIQYQLFTQIKTGDGQIVYTSWSIFYGLEYFDNMLESDRASKCLELLNSNF